MLNLCFLFIKFKLRGSDLQKSMQTESTTFKVVQLSQDQNNPDHRSLKDSSENLSRLNVAVIASPGTDLFHALHERSCVATINPTNGIAKDVISTKGEGLV